jgi:hypothetical protein
MLGVYVSMWGWKDLMKWLVVVVVVQVVFSWI